MAQWNNKVLKTFPLPMFEKMNRAPPCEWNGTQVKQIISRSPDEHNLLHRNVCTNNITEN